MKLISGEHVGALAMSEPNGKIHIVWRKTLTVWEGNTFIHTDSGRLISDVY